MGLDFCQGRGAHAGAFGRVGRVEFGQDEVPAQQDSADGAYGIEGLRYVETPGSGFLGSHREDIGIGCGLQHGTSSRHDIDREEKETV